MPLRPGGFVAGRAHQGGGGVTSPRARARDSARSTSWLPLMRPGTTVRSPLETADRPRTSRTGRLARAVFRVWKTVAWLAGVLVHDQDRERWKAVLLAVVEDAPELLGEDLGLVVTHPLDEPLVRLGLAAGRASDENLPDLDSTRLVRRVVFEVSRLLHAVVRQPSSSPSPWRASIVTAPQAACGARFGEPEPRSWRTTARRLRSADAREDEALSVSPTAAGACGL